MEATINLKEMLQVLQKRWMMIVSITGLAVVLAAIVSFFIITPVYQASTQILVNQKQKTDSEQVQYNQVQTNLQLVNTYSVVITSPAILEEVIGQLDLNTTAEKLAKNISVTSEKQSQVISVSVLNTSPKKAEAIANTIAEVFKEQIKQIMNADNVTILAKSVPADTLSPVKPRPFLNTAIAAVVALMLSVGLAFLFEYFDTSVKREQDVEDILGLPVLGVVAQMDTVKGKAVTHTTRVRRKAVGS
ncbi:YveK family protein [Ectobacillus ponti]|uniref:Wzz/FepE/Etk N-terminal domain-containing protein n=1 Tax=Ectobacillus ponti TaxID=2961894 RepID=A0AA41X7Q2_9BACI|nr:Wzz/FepE/Etk N-terminal domain-containing protein [Ectobacillus ponti]MCP8967860.1 Wzz/FepE/Etk N-terminal domain-containing protein [Ectobacillus ponti]